MHLSSRPGIRLRRPSRPSSAAAAHCWSLARCTLHATPRRHADVCRQAFASGSNSNAAAQLDQAAQQLLQMFYSQMQQQQQPQSTGARLHVSDLCYHPAGTEKPLLDNISFSLPANQMGLLIGRSGSGKTTLLQVLSGLADQNSGAVVISKDQLLTAAQGGGGGILQSIIPCSMEDRMKQVGLVFQFPERHFIGEDVLSELTFSWPRTMQFLAERQQLAFRLPQVLQAVGLSEINVSMPPHALSGGQQRRLALALQLVRKPSVLLLDEPLAGLDWKARIEVVDLLRKLKAECTLLVVSHDLREISPLVDCAWRMVPGGHLEAVQWPLAPQDVDQ